ncbi:MAG: hypothetical protein WD851_01085 [Pirellulales bacterium]
MIVAVCQHENRRQNGRTKAGTLRYRCKDCGISWTESTAKLGGMRIGMDRAVKIIELLCEGMSVLATSRLTNSDPHTVIDLMVQFGEKCTQYMEQNIKAVHCEEIQVDEIWQYCIAIAQDFRTAAGAG